MKSVRISRLTTGVLYGTYYFYYQGWFLVFGDILLIIISLLSIYKYNIKKVDKKI